MRLRYLIISGLCLAQLSACSDEFTSDSSTGGQAQGGDGANEGGSASEAGAVGDGLGGDANQGGSADGGGELGGAAQGGAGNWGLGGEAAAGSSAAGESSLGGAPSDGCQGRDDCPMGQNCVASACVPALVSCAAQKNSYPASKDGVYWIAAPGATQRVYCDMQLSAALCGEVEGEHKGRTRDKAAIGYTMTSVLLLSQGACKMWAIRGTDLGHPFDRLQVRGGVPAGQTCIALGFAADAKLGVCNYDQAGDTCGWSTPLQRYGNYCTGCTLNKGEFDRWTLQGPVSRGGLLSSKSGTTFTTCATELP